MAFLAQGNAAGAISAGITGAISLGTAASKPIPAFKKGVIGLQGEGTETSDSIVARLSKGESVITARATKKHKALLEAVNRDQVEKYIMNVYMKGNKNHVVNDSDYRLLLAAKEGNYIMRNGFSTLGRAIESRQTARF